MFKMNILKAIFVGKTLVKKVKRNPLKSLALGALATAFLAVEQPDLANSTFELLLNDTEPALMD